MSRRRVPFPAALAIAVVAAPEGPGAPVEAAGPRGQ
jgi:hypothetical protein